MFSSKKLKPCIFTGGIFLSLFFVIAIVIGHSFASAQGLAPSDPTGTGLAEGSLADTIINIINAVLALASIIALGILIYGGIVWMTSGGIPQRIALAKRILLSAAVGFFFILISWAIVNFIINGATGGGGGGPPGGGGPGPLLGASNFGWEFVDPRVGETNVPLCVSIQAKAFENLEPETSITTGAGGDFQIQQFCTADSQCPGGLGGVCAGIFCQNQMPGSIQVSGKVLQFYPSQLLTENAVYLVTLTAGIANTSASRTADPKTWQFTTGTDMDTIPPTVLQIAGVDQVSPKDNNTDVCLAKSIKAQFSEPMDLISMQDVQTADTAAADNANPICQEGKTGIKGIACADDAICYFACDPAGLFCQDGLKKGETCALATEQTDCPASVAACSSDNLAALEINPLYTKDNANDLSFNATVLSSDRVSYAPVKHYKENTTYNPILRADVLKDRCGNHLDGNFNAADQGTPVDDYAAGTESLPDQVGNVWSFRTGTDPICTPVIDSINPVSGYYDEVAGDNSDEITITGNNFDDISSNIIFNKNIVAGETPLQRCFNPANTVTDSACVALGDWGDKQIITRIPAGDSATPTNGAVSGGVYIAVDNFECTGAPTICVGGTRSSESCDVAINANGPTDPNFSTQGCPGGVSNVVPITIPSPHIQSIVPAIGGAGTWITIASRDSNTGFGTGTPTAISTETVELINAAGARVGRLNFPCLTSWTDSSIVAEIPEGTPLGIYSIQITRSDGRHSNLGIFEVMGAAPGPGICAISESCGEIGTTFNIEGKRFGAVNEKVILKNNNPSAVPLETEADLATVVWGDESITGVKVPAGFADGNYSIFVRMAGPPVSNSNSLSFDKPCPGTPCDGDTIAPSCQPDQTICDAIGPTYSCDTTICRCVNNPLPKVVEQNSCTNGTQSPSPYRGQTDSCTNAGIAAKFDKDMDDATVVKANIQVDICGNDDCSIITSPNIDKTLWGFIFGAWEGVKEGFALQPNSDLLSNTTYRVTLKELITANGYHLDGNGNGVPDGPGPLDDDYSWIFKTSNDSCKVKSIALSPVNMSVAVLSSKPISAIPQAENCNPLNASDYNWSWTQADATIATVTNSVVPNQNQTVAGFKAGTTTVRASIPAEPLVSAGTSNITVTNKLSCNDLGITAVWKFDEDSGSVALDSSSSGVNDGTLTNNPTRLSSGCKFGKCVSLDKANDYVQMSASNSATGSIELWTSPNPIQNGKHILTFGDGYGNNFDKVHVMINGFGNYQFGFYQMGGSCVGWQIIDSGITAAANTFAQLIGTWDSSGIKFYVNGNPAGQNTNCTTGITNNPSNITIGDNTYGSANYNGSIDEVRIWNKALDISEIKSIYNQQCEALDKIYCSDSNLKAVWKLDENSGIAANDSTANNNDGQLNNNPTWKSGADCKLGYGSCLSFDGNDDFVDIPNSSGVSYPAFSVEAWVYFSDNTQQERLIIGKHLAGINNGYFLGAWYNKIDFYVSGALSPTRITTTEDFNGMWHHVAGVYGNDSMKLYVDGVEKASGSASGGISNSENVAIGSVSNVSYWQGKIDEPRIWDKALTQEEVISAMSQSCLAGGTGATLQCTNDVAGLWNFDEGGGSFVGDGSRYRNNGMLIPIQAVPWSTGCQFGGCVRLNGITQYIDVPNSASLNFGDGINDKPFTFSAWIKRASTNTGDVILSKYYTFNATDRSQYWFRVDIDGRLDIHIISGNGDYRKGIKTQDQLLNNTNWHHVAATYDGSKAIGGLALYVDGTVVPTNVPPDIGADGELSSDHPSYVAMKPTTADFQIGRYTDSANSGENFDGTIDEVRIYNRALSATEIENTYQKSMTQCVEAALYCSNPELTAVWKMDEGIGVVAGDSTKNNLDGALKNGLNNTVDNAIDYSGWASGADCKFTDGKCLEFDGVQDNLIGDLTYSTGDFIEILDQNSFKFGTDPFTIEGWFKRPVGDFTHGSIVTNQRGGGGNGFVVTGNLNRRLYFRVNQDGDYTNREIFSPVINDGDWHHFAAVREGTAIRMYVDGMRAGQNAGGTSVVELNGSTIVDVTTNNALYIGAYRNFGSPEKFKGSLDELRIWKKALTDDQIKAIWNNNDGQQCLAPQKGSACDLDLAAPMCQPNVGLCESGDPDLRCSIKSCTCQEAFTVSPPQPDPENDNPNFTRDSSTVNTDGNFLNDIACRNTAITVNFNEPIDASTIKTATTTVKAKAPSLLSEDFNAGLPAGWVTTKTDTGVEVLNWQGIVGQLYSLTGTAAGWLSSPNALSSTTNFRISFDTGSLGDGNNAIGIAWNYIDKDNYYRLIWEDPTDSYASLYPSRLVLQKRVNGALVENTSVANSDIVGRGLVESGSFVASVNQLVHFYIDVVGTKITVSNDSGVLLEYNDSSAPAILPGKIAFYTNDNDGGIFYDNLIVTEYEATNIPGTVELYSLQAATGNILADGDMERADTDVWQTYATPKVLEKSTAQKKNGSRSLHIVTDAPFAGTIGEGTMRSFMANTGDAIRVRGWVKVVKGAFVAALKDDQSGWSVQTPNITSNAWTEFALDYSTPSTGDTFLWFSTPNGGFSDSEFYVDDISVTVEHNLAVDISTAVNGSQLTITPRQYLDADRNYTLNFAGDHLVSLWNFDEGSGTTVKDWRGVNNGILSVNPPLWKTGADCKFGSCLEFDGKDGVVQYVNAGDFTGEYSNQLTVSAWIKNNSSRAGMTGNNPNWDDIIAGSSGDFVFAVGGEGYLTLQRQGGVEPGLVYKSVNSSKKVNDDQWHHVAATYNGTTLRMYVDGKPDGETLDVSGIFRAGNLWIGSTFYDEELFSGRIDDARIWSRALTDKEIADVANGGAPNPGNGNVIFSSNGNPLEDDYVWNGLTTGTEICKIGKAEIQFTKGPTASPITYKGSDSFTCAASASCVDDMSMAAGNQHQPKVNIYSVNGGPLGGVMTYKWTKSTDAPFDIINDDDIDPLTTAKPTNGQGVLTVDVNGGDAGTAKASANITIALCENPWPAVPPFQDVPAATSTNFSLWYCRDAGAMQDLTDDLPKLTVQEVTNSPGSPKPMKEYFYYDANSVNDAIGIRVYANPGRLPLTEWLDQNANVSGGQSGSFNGWQSVRAGRSLYVSAMNDVGSGIYNNIYLISYSDKSSGTLIGIYNQMISNWKFMVNGISDADIAKLQRDIRRIDDLGKIATALDSYKTANGSYPKLDAGTYLPGMSTSVWPSWQASFGNALQTSIPKDPINRLGNLNVWWKFDETTGMDIIDSGLNGYNGRMEGAIQRVSGGNCKFGGCLDFGDADQIDNVIRVPSEAANGLEDFTTDFWVKTNAEIGTVISGAKDAAGNNEFTVYWDNPNPGCVGLCPLLYTLFSHRMQPINDGAWHHIAWTKSVDASRVYIDGIWKDTKVIPGPIRSVEIPSGGLVIGQEQDDVGKSFEAIQSMKGLLDELRIWNRELSSSEIALLAAKGDADATGWNQDTNSFRCDAGTDFDSHIYHYQYNNANSYNLYGALEYVGPIWWPPNTQGNTWRQAGAPFNACTNPSNCACYNYKVGPISCSDPNLKAVWKLDENSGIVANDSTANNNDGQLNNNPSWRSGADCKPGYGSCLSFDGTDDYIDIPNSSGISYPAISIEAWVFFGDNAQQERMIVGKHLGGSNNGYFLEAWYNKIGFYVSGTPTRIITTEDFNGAWHHVAGVYNNGSMKLYVDGIEKASGSTSGGIINNSENISIGSADNASYWQGQIDEPRIWDKALTQEEIISAMKQSCQ